MAKEAYRVLVSGASGMVGKALVAELSKPSAANRFAPQVFSLVRRQPQNENEIYWDPYEQRIDIKKCEGMDAVVHLAGENIGSGDGPLAFIGRWSDRKKHMIMESRRRGTTLLSRALSSLQRKPAVFVSASGIGYYGSRGDAVLTEKEPKGEGFLSDVADVWESSCERAREAGIRTVNLRMGVVLSAQGGVVHKLYWPFFMGGGGPIASGQQYMSWLTLEDAVRGIQHVIHRADLSGPVNLCAPGSCTNAQFMQALAGAMGRPCLIPMPEPIVRTVFGEMGEETLLCSQRGAPAKMEAAGFKFMHPGIEGAMAHALSH